MVENISAQKARASVTATGWRSLQQGHKVYTRDMHWVVYKAGHIYRRRPCSPAW